jgi:archaellum biogenesis ATPase FlaH
MPTFASIAKDDEVAAESDSLPPVYTQQHDRIETPQALLSRHPHNPYCRQTPQGQWETMSTTQVDKLRHEVARRILANSQNRGSAVQTTAQRTTNTNKSAHLQNNNTENSTWLMGAQSACFLLQQNNKRRFQFSTGSISLDGLVAFPAGYQPAALASSPLSSIQTNSQCTQSQSTSSTTGLTSGYITQISGPSASGKTQLALHTAGLASLSHARIWYLCSQPPRVNVERLYQLVYHKTSLNSTDSLQESLKRIELVHVQDEFALLTSLAEIERAIQALQMNDNATPVLVIIDSLSMCLSTESESLLLQVASTLVRLARQARAAILVVNGAVRSDETKFKPALGKTWSRVADIHVWLQQADQQDVNRKIQARLDRHPVKARNNATIEFYITANGISESDTR